MELISREEALSHPFANGKYDKENANYDFILGFESYKEWLETLPIVKDRPNGEWNDDGFCGDYVCSVCKQEFDSDIPNMRGFDFALPKFCPNCGADMRGKTE